MTKRLLVVCALLATGFLGCDEKKSEDAAATAKGVEEKINKAVEELSDEARFDREYRKKACEFLTPDLVSKTFEVPRDELKQMKIMGCRYSWDDKGAELRASLSIRTLKNEKSAARWFENSTKSVTKEEVRAQMKEVTKRAKEREEIDTDAKKKTADELGDMVAEMTPDDGYTFEDVDGIGDEARQNQEDGTVVVRIDNLIARIQAYKGKTYPVEIKPGTDLKKMAEVAKKAGKEAQKKQAPQAREDSVKLAKAVVPEIE